MENVEFSHTGQEGFTTNNDPRFSIAFVQTGHGGPGDRRPSYVKGCGFHHGFSTAIGLFGCSGVVVKDNVIHRTVGPGETRGGQERVLLVNGSVGQNDPMGNYKESSPG